MMLVLVSVTAMAQLSVWDGGRAVWTHGSGTESDPYLIESARNLAFLSYAVNKGFDMDGLHFRLTTDIDLNGSEDQQWVPIGMGNRWFNDDGCDRGYPGNNYYSPETCFRGHFDGGGHFISNIYVEMDNDYGTGLFGNIHARYDTIIIQNINVLNGYVKGKEAGGIAGRTEGCCQILNCGNGATIEGLKVGGIVGVAGSKSMYKKCYNKGVIIGESGWNLGAGGIVGYGSAEIEECYNEGKVASGSYAGGIYGLSVQGRVHISNCYNTGEIIAEGNGGPASAPARWAAGGIAGFLFRGTNSITNCYNVGTISSLGAAGCILGYGNNYTTCENNYYINSCDAGGEGTPLSEDFMHSQVFVGCLNNETNVWTMDANNLNHGYPILIDNCPQPYTLSARSNDEALGRVHVIKYPNYESNSATVVAEPISGSFLNWSINGQVVSTANPFTFAVEEDTELVGNFCANHIVNARPSDASLGSASVLQQPDCATNNIAIVLAEPIGDHPFLGWMVNGQVVSTANPYSFEVEEDVELVANFYGTGIDEEIAQKIIISPNPTKGVVNIGCENMKDVVVYAMDGRAEKTYAEVNSNIFALDMSDLAKGVYVLRVVMQDGLAVNKKIIKE